MKVYYAPICIHCRNFMHLVKLRGLEDRVEAVNIIESTANMKEFLRLRDTSDLYIPVRQEGRIGIPCFVVGEDVILDVNEALARIGEGLVQESEILEHPA